MVFYDVSIHLKYIYSMLQYKKCCVKYFGECKGERRRGTSLWWQVNVYSQKMLSPVCIHTSLSTFLSRITTVPTPIFPGPFAWFCVSGLGDWRFPLLIHSTPFSGALMTHTQPYSLHAWSFIFIHIQHMLQELQHLSTPISVAGPPQQEINESERSGLSY